MRLGVTQAVAEKTRTDFGRFRSGNQVQAGPPGLMMRHNYRVVRNRCSDQFEKGQVNIRPAIP